MKTHKPIVRRRAPVPGRTAHRRLAATATRFYAALIHKEGRGGYGVVFPDLPGCTSAGDTLDEALLNAQDALQGHIEVTAEYGDAVPAPTPIHRLRLGAADKRHLVHVQLVPVVMPGKAVKVMVSLDGGLLSRIDAAAGHYGRSRFLAEAARSKLTGG
ncbi:MAG: type II toxin-antitoxin system HicB family antitoxin [Rhodospirillaceae bacterium]|nr:type II toxin-antitoxin system HicB family antitoxin [Rhodospirillaceae bacterium]